jgi:hypothetical protein
MHQHLAHRTDFVLEHGLAVEANDSSNATHDANPPGVVRLTPDTTHKKAF